MVDGVKALIFDVFGTVVDWRGSVARLAAEFARKHDLPEADWDRFARDWRNLYQPSMQRVRSGELPFTKLDVLHRMNSRKSRRNMALEICRRSARRTQSRVAPALLMA